MELKSIYHCLLYSAHKVWISFQNFAHEGNRRLKYYLKERPSKLSYLKVASSNTSRLEAHAGFFRLLMKGIFDPYLLRPFDKKLISQLVTRIRTHDYMVQGSLVSTVSISAIPGIVRIENSTKQLKSPIQCNFLKKIKTLIQNLPIKLIIVQIKHQRGRRYVIKSFNVTLCFRYSFMIQSNICT